MAAMTLKGYYTLLTNCAAGLRYIAHPASIYSTNMNSNMSGALYFPHPYDYY